MTPAVIEQATFWSVAQHLNHCATAVPIFIYSMQIIGLSVVTPIILMSFMFHLSHYRQILGP